MRLTIPEIIVKQLSLILGKIQIQREALMLFCTVYCEKPNVKFKLWN
jgi:hypothetical protein